MAKIRATLASFSINIQLYSQNNKKCIFESPYGEGNKSPSSESLNAKKLCCSQIEFYYSNVTTFSTLRSGICRRNSVRLSVCLPVTFVHPTRKCFYAILYLSHQLTSQQNFSEIVPEKPIRQGLNARGVAVGIGHVEGYISETVQDTASDTINNS